MVKNMHIPSGSTVPCISRSGQEKAVRALLATQFPLAQEGPEK